MISRRNVSRLRTVFAVGLGMAVLSFFLLNFATLTLQQDLATPELVAGALISGLFGVLFSSYELFYVEGRHGRWIRRAPFVARLAISIGVFLLIMTIIGGIYEKLMYPDFGPNSYMGLQVANRKLAFVGDLLVGLVMFVCVFVVFALRRVIDGPTLVNLLSGRYRQAVHGERIFLILDLVNSTAMTAQLGEVHAYELISSVFFDVDEVILNHAGVTDRYRGDEIVVTWSMQSGLDQANCIRCVFAVQALLDRHAHRYQNQAGWHPRFRAGLHCGPVAIGECGDSRREIQYFGDTINTASRIQSYCRELGEDLLLSEDLLQRLNLDERFVATDLGEFELRGRQDALRLFSLRESQAPPVVADGEAAK